MGGGGEMIFNSPSQKAEKGREVSHFPVGGGKKDATLSIGGRRGRN